MLQDQSNILLQYLLVFILRQQQHVEASVGSRQVQRVWMTLDQEFQRFQPINRHTVRSCDKSQEAFFLFMLKTMQQVPKLSECKEEYLMMVVSGVYPPS